MIDFVQEQSDHTIQTSETHPAAYLLPRCPFHILYYALHVAIFNFSAKI